MLPLDPSLFGNAQYAWIWYSNGLTIIGFLMTAAIALYITYSAQQANLRTPLWIVISILAWLLNVAAFLLTVDALAFPERPFAARLLPQNPDAQVALSNPINLFALLGMVGCALGLFALGGYLARIAVTEQAAAGWGAETGATFVDASATAGIVPPTAGGEMGAAAVPPTQAPGMQPASATAAPGAPATNMEQTIVRRPGAAEAAAEREPSRTVVMRRPPREMAWLVQITGPHTGRVFRLGRVTEIGRDPGLNQIVVDDPEASSLHAIIRLVEGQFVIQDRGSTNGTFVNGEEVVKHTLADHDVIKIGQTEFVFLQVKAS